MSPHEIECVDLVGVDPGAAPPLAADEAAVSRFVKHREQLPRPHGRVGIRVVQLPELCMGVDDVRYERKPGLRLLAAETEEASPCLADRGQRGVDLAERCEQLACRHSLSPQ